jgi:small subunit ribosomal protein S9
MKKKYIFTKAKRKEAVARCVLEYPGKGIVRYNKMLVDTIQNKFLRELIKEPLYLAGDLAKKVNIRVKVKGGGVSGQIQAARTAIAKALAKCFEQLKEVFESYDRYLLRDDTRRVEPKKPLGRKARAKKQTSYR